MYKYCFVPECKSTTISTPQKLFIFVPLDVKRRKLWMTAARRNYNDLSVKSKVYCCEDHFDLEKDMENFMEVKLMGTQIRMKKEVVPHKFHCQAGRCNIATTPRTTSVTRQRREYVDSILSVPSTSTASEEPILENIAVEESVFHMPSIPEVININKSFADKSIQVKIQTKRKLRSKSTMCNISSLFKQNKSSSPLKLETVDIGTSPVKFNIVPAETKVPLQISDTSFASDTTVSSAVIEQSTSSFDSELENLEIEENKKLANRVKLFHIHKDPKMYIGIPKEWLPLINILHSRSGLSKECIFLTLSKIKMDDSFQRLADDFGISKSYASMLFERGLLLSLFFKQFVYMPEKEVIKRNLPIAFRARYSNVVSIIDCFEIEIQKPLEPLRQSLTWSDYKKCNTIKYLISSTPDGFVNFVSSGYGGRVSDVTLFEDSKYMDILPDGSTVMADRGFKHLLNVLKKNNCDLVKPPSVQSGTKLTKSDVLKTRQIASLRINIENVIGRVRNFQYVLPHSCIHHSLIHKLDNVMIIVCGIINMQSPILKK